MATALALCPQNPPCPAIVHKMAGLSPMDHVILKDSRHASLRGDGPGVFATLGP